MNSKKSMQLDSQNVFLPSGFKRSVLRFEENRARLQALQIVPYTFRNVHCTRFCSCFQHDAFRQIALVVIEHFLDAATKQDNRLAGCGVKMDRLLRAWFQRVEHSLALVSKRSPEVIIHAKPFAGFSFCAERIKYFCSKYHIN